MPQGHCTLPADDAGRVLDRLAGLEQMIRPEDVQQSPTATGRVNSVQLSVDARGRLVGGAGHGVVDRFADPTGLQGRPAAPQRRGVAAPLQPLRRPSAVGRGAGAAPVPPSRSSPGPAGDAGGVLRRLAVDGARRHDLRRPRLGGQRDHLRPPLGRAARRGAFPQVRKLSLVELGTHVEVAMVVRSSAHGEPAMVAGLFRHLTSEMLLLWTGGSSATSCGSR